MSGEYVIEVIATADGRRVGPPPRYVELFDPDAHDGRGHIELTTDPAAALRFPDQVAAWQCWKQASTVRPTRPDGQPNRPLTAFTVSVRGMS